jgi:hypothetical protein
VERLLPALAGICFFVLAYALSTNFAIASNVDEWLPILDLRDESGQIHAVPIAETFEPVACLNTLLDESQKIKNAIVFSDKNYSAISYTPNVSATITTRNQVIAYRCQFTPAGTKWPSPRAQVK